MEVHVGTSGWAYAWNRGGSLAWFAERSGLDAIELNASFYGFPSEKSVLSWADAGSGLRWSVKVNRSVTHRHRFNEKAVGVWERFRERFLPLDDLIDFYLFQAPPAFRDVDRILAFAGATGLGERCTVEIRNPVVLGDDEACRRLQEQSSWSRSIPRTSGNESSRATPSTSGCTGGRTGTGTTTPTPNSRASGIRLPPSARSGRISSSTTTMPCSITPG
ncbi:protein of unknown function [Methanoculleus bourgensis]|uniref:DUF72 domain-containing protein n=1 Tax=Methanoculleus bourgensis TaxID=83986 RepID=A0A0X8XZ29_9EURY|nr:protein of unknown function [Methanoculleus bourgensis]